MGINAPAYLVEQRESHLSKRKHIYKALNLLNTDCILSNTSYINVQSKCSITAFFYMSN